MTISFRGRFRILWTADAKGFMRFCDNNFGRAMTISPEATKLADTAQNIRKANALVTSNMKLEAVTATFRYGTPSTGALNP